jgi:polyisoprenoid-binding protein YceI
MALAGSVLTSLLPIASGSAHAASWTVDPARSTLGFSGTQTGAPFTGKFKTWTATIDFDPAKLEVAHVRVDVDVASATTDDPQKDAALPGEDWFDAGKFAHATFEATGFKAAGGDAFETSGHLTLRGIVKPVTLPFTLTIKGDEAHAVGHAKLVRTDFGVGGGQWADGAMVGLDVTVDVDLVATKK